MPTTTTTITAAAKDDALVCPLCTETMTVLQKDSLRIITQRRRSLLLAAIQRDDCCQQYVCQSCLYRHVHSILEEGIAGCGGAERMTLTCPLGCGKEMTNADVRACFNRQHNRAVVSSPGAAFWSLFFGPCIVYPLCLLWIILFPFCCWNSEDDDHDDDDYFVLRHKYWIYCHSTRAEQNDVRQYERWSLAVALRTIQRQQENGLPIVMHCPSPNCDYTWLVANPAYREAKRVHEGRKIYLWYTSPKPEQQQSEYSSSLTNKKDDSFDDWCRPEFLNMSRAYKNKNTTNAPGPCAVDWLSAENSNNNTDGRYMCCAKCHVSFCGLCRQPWRFGSKCHVGIACRAYRRQLPAAIQQQQQENGSAAGEAFAFFTSNGNNNNNDGRCCPGCSMFTSRTGGCNHMTCVCGMQWCYVCEQRWNSLHYGCVDRPPEAATLVDCVIS